MARTRVGLWFPRGERRVELYRSINEFVHGSAADELSSMPSHFKGSIQLISGLSNIYFEGMTVHFGRLRSQDFELINGLTKSGIYLQSSAEGPDLAANILNRIREGPLKGITPGRIYEPSHFRAS